MTQPPIRIVHTADLHVGVENYGRVDPATGVNSRVMDFLRRLTDVGDYAIDEGADLFIFAGDAYKVRDPNPTYQREFARRIKRIADAGIPVILLVGNHDLPAIARRATSIDIFGTLEVPNVYVGNREEVIQLTCRRGQAVQIALAPYPLRSALLSREEHRDKSLAELDAALQDAMIENITGMAAQARAQPGVPAILVGHFSVNEASQGSERNIMIGRDAALPRSVLADRTWRYVALGHIHKHQNLNPSDQPPVVYSGSLERIDFGEEGEPKGFVVAEIGEETTTWRFVEKHRREARPFVTIRTDVRGAADPTAAAVAAIQARGDLSESVVRVILALRQEQEPLLNEREVLRALAGAHFTAAVQKDVERTERQRLGALPVEQLAPPDLLGRYFDVKQVPTQRAQVLLERAAGLMREVDESDLDT